MGRLLYPHPVWMVTAGVRRLHAFRNRYAFDHGQGALCGNAMDGCLRPTPDDKATLPRCQECERATKDRQP